MPDGSKTLRVILNFHGVGKPSRDFEKGEEPYWINVQRFREILDLAANAAGTLGGITFDDGNDSDFLVAVPELRARRMNATFFVLAGRLGERGYLTAEQVRQIDADPLFSIGSHGLMHRAWPELCDDDLVAELSRSRAILSELCGRPVHEAGLPFGRYDKRTLRHLAAQGYTAVYSSDGGPGLCRRAPVSRFSVRSDMPLNQIRAMLDGQAFTTRIANELRILIKRIR